MRVADNIFAKGVMVCGCNREVLFRECVRFDARRQYDPQMKRYFPTKDSLRHCSSTETSHVCVCVFVALNVSYVMVCKAYKICYAVFPSTCYDRLIFKTKT